MVAQDPFDVDVLWERMYNLTRPFGQKGAVPNAISANDIAIWDCMGRALGKPVHKLLGVEEDIAYVRAVREAIGPKPKLMVDAGSLT